MLLPVFLMGQEPQADRRFHVGVDRPVDIGARTVATVEPYLAIDPYDPKHMVASVSLANQMGDRGGVMVAVARSRARRWRRSMRGKRGSDTIFQGGAAWIRGLRCFGMAT
jgi:hypothetical protein